MVLKSMREATPKDGLFDNDQTRLYESLLDQQMGQVLARRGGADGGGGLGLAALIESQRRGTPPMPIRRGFPAGLLPLSGARAAAALDPARAPVPLPATTSPALPMSTVLSPPPAGMRCPAPLPGHPVADRRRFVDA